MTESYPQQKSAIQLLKQETIAKKYFLTLAVNDLRLAPLQFARALYVRARTHIHITPGPIGLAVNLDL